MAAELWQYPVFSAAMEQAESYLAEMGATWSLKRTIYLLSNQHHDIANSHSRGASETGIRVTSE